MSLRNPVESDMRGHRYKSGQGNRILPLPFPWVALPQEALQGSSGWEGFLQRELICLEQGGFGSEVRNRGKGGTSFGLHSAEVLRLELNSKGL